MAVPTYAMENAYTYIKDMRPVLSIMAEYQASTPEGAFERSLQRQLGEAHQHFLHEEFSLALASYRELRALILRVVDPQLPAGSGPGIDWSAVDHARLLDPLIGVASEMLANTPIDFPPIPPTLLGSPDRLPDAVRKQLQPAFANGLTNNVGPQVQMFVEKAGTAVAVEDWKTAAGQFEIAIEHAKNAPAQVRAALFHDLSLTQDKMNDSRSASANAMESVKLFKRAKLDDRTIASMTLLESTQIRSGQVSEAKATRNTLVKLITKRHVGLGVGAVVMGPGVGRTSPTSPSSAVDPNLRVQPITVPGRSFGPGRVGGSDSGGSDDAVPLSLVGQTGGVDSGLMSWQFLSLTSKPTHLNLVGQSGTEISIALGGTGTAGLKKYYDRRAAIVDLSLIDLQGAHYTQFVAFIPHLYFFVLPMAIADCLAEMGRYAAAEAEYLSVLVYPFVNRAVEMPKLWTRLARLNLWWGDYLYRKVPSSSSDFGAAKAKYERIVKTSGAIDANSPLYKHSTLRPMRDRARDVMAATDPVTFDENPVMIAALLEASGKLTQIANAQNYFGLTASYVPPFTFEYLQSTARYLAQQAMQIEQRYVQFKSQAENAEFRLEQLEQQVAVAEATVELERSGHKEAAAGVDVAQASQNYAAAQHQNAVDAKNAFSRARWDLLNLAGLEAWAAASSVDRDDQVKLTITGYSVYESDHKRRNVVLKDLARKRTRITHDLEAGRLQREIASASAYKAVTDAQVAQAQARVATALQRIAVAQLQQRFAEENRDFLELKEFGAGMWYELARQMRGIMRRYLDLAIEAAFMMERAYAVETDRNLGVIKFDYGIRGTAGLAGAESLQADIDHFTIDYLRSQTKRAPMKQVFSLSDTFPIAFAELKENGTAFFETVLTDFDRGHPGYYLRKIRNVEVMFLGLTSSSGVKGTLRNIGVSTFRHRNGSTDTLVYPSDVMPLSLYEVRNDALLFRADPKTLRLFENNGVATMWRLDLPLDANEFDLGSILDVQIIISYDAMFDPALEGQVTAALPTAGSATRGLSMRFEAPDELYYLKSQANAEIVFDANSFSFTQENLVRTRLVVSAKGVAAPGLTIGISSLGTGTTMMQTLNADGKAVTTGGGPLGALIGNPVLDTWVVDIPEGHNPGLVIDGSLDLSGLEDIMTIIEYDFDYRSTS